MAKNRKRKSHVLGCVAAILICLTAGGMSVEAQGGSVTVQLKELDSDFSVRGNVTICGWQVGEVDERNMPVFDVGYGITTLPETAEKLEAVTESLAEQTQSAAPDMEERTDTSGKVVFTGLEDGVYLFAVKQAERYGKVAPFLVMMPEYYEENGELKGPLFQIEVEPKSSPYVKPEEPGRPGEDEPKKSGEDEPEKSGDNGQEKGKTVKTGDETDIDVMWMAAGMSGCVILFTVITKKKRGRKQP